MRSNILLFFSVTFCSLALIAVQHSGASSRSPEIAESYQVTRLDFSTLKPVSPSVRPAMPDEIILDLKKHAQIKVEPVQETRLIEAPALPAAIAPQAAALPQPEIEPETEIASMPFAEVIAEPEPQSAVYTVKRGDNLTRIAVNLYGSSDDVARLIADNPTLQANPNVLLIGQELRYVAAE